VSLSPVDPGRFPSCRPSVRNRLGTNCLSSKGVPTGHLERARIPSMRIRKASISNIQAIESLVWRPPKNVEVGWHVILGDNGSGKTSFLRALSLALLGPEEAIAARQDWNAWIRHNTRKGSVSIDIVADPKFDPPRVKGTNEKTIVAEILLNRGKTKTVPSESKQPIPPLWSESKGWFSAAYGPFRRFSGGDKEAESVSRTNPRLGAHISIFGENVALPQSLFWLQDLRLKELEERNKEPFLDKVRAFVNQDGFLPHGVNLTDVSSSGVFFQDGNQIRVSVQDLSDGYRSILSMTFELLRQLTYFFPESQIFDVSSKTVKTPGVVMIDEIDAHLHPTWQKKIGFWLTEHFPNLQFLVTTHSPLICQAAVNGSIFHLGSPGEQERSKMLLGPERDRLLYGDILEAYSTEAFGTADTRSHDAHLKQERLAELNVKELAAGLSESEKREQEKLRSIFATSPHSLGKS
jgi:predicted ATPase